MSKLIATGIIAMAIAMVIGMNLGHRPSDIERIESTPAYQAELAKRNAR